jgi:RHS repeat-associated protein
MNDQSGAITYARTYDPYGVVTQAGGASQSAYGYTGEMSDVSGLTYLRARYYNPQDGRFQSRDTWGGDANQPITYNRWLYTNANPIIYTDPSGHYHYDRSKAVQEAMTWDDAAGLDPMYDFTTNPLAAGINFESECTLFASSVLYHGGVRDTRGDPFKKQPPESDDATKPYWDLSYLMDTTTGWMAAGYGDTWYDTGLFYNFTTSIVGRRVFIYNNPPQRYDGKYRGDAERLGQKNLNNWYATLTRNAASIQKGDLVFYKKVGQASWGHVAVIVGWESPTYFGNKPDWEPDSESPNGCDPSPLFSVRPKVPAVVERSGGIKYESYRSLDNTLNPVSQIAIVHIEDRWSGFPIRR